VKPGDILISVTADIGIIGVIPNPFEEAYVNQHIALVRPVHTACPRWIGRFLSFGATATFFRRLNDTGAKAGMNLPAVQSLQIAMPIRSEQDRMTAILDSMDADIDRQRQVTFKLLHLKSGLTNDLLTGRIRVPAESGGRA
jgi:type I restriction enzyme S subunit